MQCAVFIMLCILCNVQLVRIFQIVVCIVHCAVCFVQCTVCIVHYVECSVWSAVYIVQCIVGMEASAQLGCT